MPWELEQRRGEQNEGKALSGDQLLPEEEVAVVTASARGLCTRFLVGARCIQVSAGDADVKGSPRLGG